MTSLEGQDVRRPAEYELHASGSSASKVDSLEVAVDGQIKGRAEIQLWRGEKMEQSRRIQDDVHVKLGGEWYSDSAKIKYLPFEVTGGSIRVRYAFTTP